jgi:hypothetical protein
MKNLHNYELDYYSYGFATVGMVYTSGPNTEFGMLDVNPDTLSVNTGGVGTPLQFEFINQTITASQLEILTQFMTDS